MRLRDHKVSMKLRLILLLAIAGSAACHRDQGASSPTRAAKPKAGVHAAAPNQSGPNPQELTAGMVEAVAQGKAPGAVDLKFDLLERPVPGQPLDVAIALLPQTAARSATVAVTGSDGLKVDPGEAQFEFPAVEAAQVYRHSIKVTPTSEGFYLLTFAVSLQHEQTSDSRVFSVPILVGSDGGAASAPAGRAPAGSAAQQADAHRGS
jgi:hypothetical protein